MRPDGLTARGWLHVAGQLDWLEVRYARVAPGWSELYREKMARIEARARREAQRNEGCLGGDDCAWCGPEDEP